MSMRVQISLFLYLYIWFLHLCWPRYRVYTEPKIIYIYNYICYIYLLVSSVSLSSMAVLKRTNVSPAYCYSYIENHDKLVWYHTKITITFDGVDSSLCVSYDEELLIIDRLYLLQNRKYSINETEKPPRQILNIINVLR